MVVLPASTRLLIGHEMNPASRSTTVTSMSGDHIFTYLAAVPPPMPAPMTTTRPALPPPVVAHPASDMAPGAAAAAAAHCMNSRLEIVLAVSRFDSESQGLIAA